MGKKNKEKQKESKEKDNVSTSGGIKRFFAKITRKKTKDKKNTNESVAEKEGILSPDDNNSVSDITIKDASNPVRTRRRAVSAERFRLSPKSQLRDLHNDHNLNDSRYSGTRIQSDASLADPDDPEDIRSDNFVNRLRNISRESRSQHRCRPTTLSESSAVRTFPTFMSLPSSPSHLTETSHVTPIRPYSSDPPTPPSRQTRAVDRTPMKVASPSLTNELKEKRQKRQRYHAEKGRLIRSGTAEEILLLQRQSSVKNGLAGSDSINNRLAALHLDSMSERRNERTSLRAGQDMTSPASDVNSESCYLSCERKLQELVNKQSSIFRFDHVDSVSLQSLSPTSTLERQRSTRQRNGDDGRQAGDSKVNDVGAVIHYHLTIQNCDGINIYVNSPGGDTFSPSAVQVDEGGLLKRLSWSQSPAEQGTKHPSAVTSRQQSDTVASIVSEDKDEKNKSPGNRLRRYNSTGPEDRVLWTENTNNATDSVAHSSASKPKMYPWRTSRMGHSKEIKQNSCERTIPAATRTSPGSPTRTMSGVCSVPIEDRQNRKGSSSSDSESQPDNPKTSKVRPVAHVSPRRRVERPANLQQTSSRPAYHQHTRPMTSHSFSQSQTPSQIQTNVSSRDAAARNQSESSTVTNFVGQLSGSLSSLTTEALLEADANGNVSTSDLDTTLNDDSYSSSDSVTSVVEIVNSYNRESRRGEYGLERRTHSPVSQNRNERRTSRPASAERQSTYMMSSGSYNVPQNSSVRRIQSLREDTRPGNTLTSPERLAVIRRELARVPGVLIVTYRRNRVLVYLSRNRPNVEGVVRFMMARGIPQTLYDCEVMPYRVGTTNGRQNTSSRDLLVESR